MTNEKIIDLSKPSLSYNDVGEPWKVVLTHPIDFNNWYIFNTVTKKYKKIGRVQLKGVSYFQRAIEEAKRRNNATVFDM